MTLNVERNIGVERAPVETAPNTEQECEYNFPNGVRGLPWIHPESIPLPQPVVNTDEVAEELSRLATERDETFRVGIDGMFPIDWVGPLSGNGVYIKEDSSLYPIVDSLAGTDARIVIGDGLSLHGNKRNEEKEDIVLTGAVSLGMIGAGVGLLGGEYLRRRGIREHARRDAQAVRESRGNQGGVSRRDFLRLGGSVALGLAAAGCGLTAVANYLPSRKLEDGCVSRTERSSEMEVSVVNDIVRRNVGLAHKVKGNGAVVFGYTHFEDIVWKRTMQDFSNPRALNEQLVAENADFLKEHPEVLVTMMTDSVYNAVTSLECLPYKDQLGRPSLILTDLRIHPELAPQKLKAMLVSRGQNVDTYSPVSRYVRQELGME